ncbi:MAG: hypothetical protein KAG28_05820 [Cocleimonas sp.]|nr:hypothetical protein [Cocleimonas sp.]
MKKIIPTLFFKNNLLHLTLFISFAIFSLSSAIAVADPLKKTVISKRTLSRIVAQNYPRTKLSKAQIMLAILATNPHAFKGNNINFMMSNKKLSLPSKDFILGISKKQATRLINKHNRSYRKGKTGNFAPPNFGTIAETVARNGSINKSTTESNPAEATAALEKLQVRNTEQAKQVEVLAKESEELQSLVKRLETEKEKRDVDLNNLEDKISVLQKTVDENEDTIKEPSITEDNLRKKNEILQQKLIETKSELAENNRTTISLERRITEIQDESTPKATETTSKKNTEDLGTTVDRTASSTVDTTVEPNDTGIAGHIDKTDKTTGIASETGGEEKEGSLFGFATPQLMWLLPLLAVLAGIGLLIARFFKRKKHDDLNLDDVDNYDFSTPKMSDKQRYQDNNTASPSPLTEAPLEISIKLDVARAYMEAEDHKSAYEMLQEVLKEGNEEQKIEAQQLLNKL